MRKIHSFIFAASAALLSVVSCQEPVEEVKSLEIAAYTIAESAEFGDKVDFTVTSEVAQNVTVAIVKDGKQFASATVREAQEGVFAGSLDIPYQKNIEDGQYDVMVMAMGAGTDRAEKTLKIALAHPTFTSVDFVAGSDRFALSSSDAASPLEAYTWSYVGKLPAALSGYFEAKTADGSVYSFGGSNVDNIEFGNTTAVALYNYESEILEGTITFDVKSFQVKYPLEAMWVEVPETTDPAYPGTADVEFKKGQVVSFAGLGNLWVDIDFFDNNGDGTYTFRAEGGLYRLTNQADWGSLRIERLSATTGDLGTFTWDEMGNITSNEAIWCLGNYNFGKPDKRAVRDGRLFSDWETFDGYCMAKIDDYKYQITLRVYNYASLKFFQTKLNWGDIYSANYDTANSTFENCYLISTAGSDGNIQQGQGLTDPNKFEYPSTGVVLRFTFDVTDPLGIKATVEDITDQNVM
ncbi:MAG: DUF5121 domain-containing protein [Bacteroidales bacterium]|nr:DUF5121 domain-containing protein [Bacteroidales bacterium]